MMQELVHSGNTYLSYVSLDAMFDHSKVQKKTIIWFVLLSDFCIQIFTSAENITNTTKLQNKTAVPLLNKILL